MHSPDTRWVQRFTNFERTFLLLRDALTIDSPSRLERAGIIQFFKVGLELALKVLRDYQTAECSTPLLTPKQAIHQGCIKQLISREADWINALQCRRLIAESYNENNAIALEQAIRRRYYGLLQALYQTLKQKTEGGGNS